MATEVQEIIMANHTPKKSKKLKAVSKYPTPKSSHAGKSGGGNEPSPELKAAKNTNQPVQAVQDGIKTSQSTDSGIRASTLEEILFIKELLAKPRGRVQQPNFSPLAINVGIESTGLKFQIGKLCRPNSKDVSYSLSVLVEIGIFEDDLVEWDFDFNSLFGSNSYEWRKRYVHKVVNMIGIWHDTVNGWQYPFTPDEVDKTEMRVLAAAWVLMCWDWVVNPGKRPEPRLPGVFNAKKHQRVAIPQMLCPICGKKAPNPAIRTRLAVRLRIFHHWLPQHAQEYHGYGTLTHKRMHQPRKFNRTSKRSK